jgi:hypothetical protein
VVEGNLSCVPSQVGAVVFFSVQQSVGLVAVGGCVVRLKLSSYLLDKWECCVCCFSCIELC